uniref:RNA polymerase subunit beta'' n=1 Tax=Prototheca miyajii TaxID=2034260 RepID=UPI0030027342
MNNYILKKLREKKQKSVFFNGPFDKGNLKKLIALLLFEYGEKPTLDFLENLKLFGFTQATQAGISLGVDDLKIPKEKKKLLIKTNFIIKSADEANLSGKITFIEKSQQIIDLWNATNESIREDITENFKYKIPLNSLAMMTFSGARGNISQARQLVGMRGLMADPLGNIVNYPIQSNFREGITLTEYIISCYGARKGLVDTALRTATSGYLTRRLVDAVQHLVISSMDCHTNTGVLIKNPKNEIFLIGRVLAKKLNKKNFKEEKINNYFPYFFSNTKINLKKRKTTFFKENKIISLTLARQIIQNQKEIYIRSPLTCQAYKSVCQLCYGWDLTKGELVAIGEAIGIVAAQSIGEPGTQLTMRTFHTGGVGVFAEESIKTHEAPAPGFINFPEKLAGHFVRTTHGKIAYIIKYININPNRVILEIKKDKDNKPFFILQEDDLPPGSLLLVRQGENVYENTIIAQTIQLQAKKQGVSLHPIQSQTDGEIQFDSITTHEMQLDLGMYFKFPLNTIAPRIKTINFLKKVGSFWVFSTKNQRELYPIKSFVQIGDLLSLQSPLFQINFYISFYTKIKKLKSQVIFEKPALSLPINLIRFHKNTYSSTWYGKKETLFFWKFNSLKNQQNFKLFWYSEKWAIQKLSFICISVKYVKGDFSLFNKEKLKPAKIKKGSKKEVKQIQLNLLDQTKIKEPYFGNIFYVPHSFYALNSLLTINVIYLTKIKRKALKSGKFFKSSIVLCINSIPQFVMKFGIYKIALNLKNKKSFFKKPSIFIKNPLIQLQSNKTTKFFYNYLRNYSTFIGQIVFYNLNVILNDTNINKINNKNLFYCKKNWMFLSLPKKNKLYFSNFNKSLRKFILLKNNFTSHLSFENQAITVEYISVKKLHFLKQKTIKKNKTIQNYKLYWYNKKNFLDINKCWYITNCIQPKTKIKNDLLKHIDKALIFYKLKKRKLKLNPVIKKHRNLIKKEKKKSLFYICIIEKIHQKPLPFNINFQKHWASVFYKNYKFQNDEKKISPSFLKQNISLNFPNENIDKLFAIQFKLIFGWQSPKNLFNFQLKLNTNKILKKFYNIFVPEVYQYLKVLNLKENRKIEKVKVFKREKFQLLCYTLFPEVPFSLNCQNLKFQTFQNEWVLPLIKIATGFKISKIKGDLTRYTRTINQTYWSNLNKNNILALNVETKNIGQCFKHGQIISNNFASPINGKIVQINKDWCSIRYGFPHLTATGSFIHVFDNDVILKNRLLLTLRSRKFQTQDIVQGIPKIEQLFEARNVRGEENSLNIHQKLQNSFLDFLEFFNEKQQTHLSIIPLQKEQINNFELVSKRTILKIQNFIVFNINEAYLNQGVSISEKHFEIIVREMTARVRVLSSGSSGFLPGEIVYFKTLQRVNNRLIKNKQTPAIYDPIVLGITKSVLYSESFLLAASFQEVSRVLVQSVLEKKTDFLSGLHENVIVGQMIPAGAHVFSRLPINEEFQKIDKKINPYFKNLKKVAKIIEKQYKQFKNKNKKDIKKIENKKDVKKIENKKDVKKIEKKKQNAV